MVFYTFFLVTYVKNDRETEANRQSVSVYVHIAKRKTCETQDKQVSSFHMLIMCFREVKLLLFTSELK